MNWPCAKVLPGAKRLYAGLPAQQASAAVLLFGLDGDFYNAGDLIAQLALDIIGAEGFDRLADQLGLGDVEAVLGLDGVGDLLGGDAAEELFTGAGLGGDGDRALLELGGQGQSGLFSAASVPGGPCPAASGC